MSTAFNCVLVLLVTLENLALQTASAPKGLHTVQGIQEFRWK